MLFRSFKIPTRYLLSFLAVTLFFIQLGLALSDLPSVKLMQDIICKHHYGVTSNKLLLEEICRLEPIQQELNTISMGILISMTIASALVASPFGILADRVGRIPVLGMSILGMLLSQAYAMYVCFRWKTIDLRAIWAMGVPLLLGGGRSVAEAMVFTIISDVVPDTKRATWFQWVVGAVLAAQLLAPIISGALIQASIWLPLILSLGLVAVAGLWLVLFSPETLTTKKARETFRLDPATDREPALRRLRLFLSRPFLLLLPGTVVVIPLASVQSDLLLRLMPIQFNWPLNRSALLISLRSLATLVTLFFILPGINYLCCRNPDDSAFRRDSTLARVCAIFFVLGSFFLMMISNEVLVILGIIVSALGSGLPTLCRAMLVNLVGKEKTGSIFGTLAVGEILGFLVCELGMGSLFGVGLKTWLGLPFAIGTALASGIGIATWCVPLPQRKTVDEDLNHKD